MPVLVQKFGGTSVSDATRIHLAARRAIRAKLAGNQIVLVVSAMGKTTDKLVKLAQEVSRRPSRREMDMLVSTGEQVSIALMAMAIHESGHEAISLTGAQLGMRTDSSHMQARIHSIDTRRAQTLLDAGKIVIVAGFQGVDSDFNITTLGRGGSDTTAVAIAAAFKAAMCEIYTDVDGVFTTDPRIVPAARKIDAISYDEMLELASLGAGVMHPRSIEFGKKYSVPIHVRSSFTDQPGTQIMAEVPGMEEVLVSGATLKRPVARIAFVGVRNTPGAASKIFTALAQRGLSVDDIIQVASPSSESPAVSAADGPTPERVTVAFTVAGTDFGEAHAVADALGPDLGIERVEAVDGLAKVSVVGVGMRSHHGVAATLFSALSAAGINIENITTSEISISVLVPLDQAEGALRAAHDAFQLGQSA